MKTFYRFVTQHPKAILLVVFLMTIYMFSSLSSLRWETDARVYMPEGHPAILYDEKIEHLFGVKDALIIGIVNSEQSIYNAETLARVARITEKVANLPGVIANRTLDVASLATASAFSGTETELAAVRLMDNPPETAEEIERLEALVAKHADLFVGNLVSADGTATVIRAKLKEGAVNRYQSYWQIKGILAAEQGDGDQSWGQWGGWSAEEVGEWQQNSQGWSGAESGQWGDWQGGEGVGRLPNGDEFFLAGRPVIEVTSGQHALEDVKVMIPMLIAVMAIVLFLIFRTGRGVVIPLAVMGGAIVWTLGTMALMGVPFYTISTMLPVILVAIGIGDSVHFLSTYYNKVLEDRYRQPAEVVYESLCDLGPPLITTSVTTAIGFLSLVFAQMPPFKVFGLFTVLGIFYSWLLTIVFAAAILTLVSPKVSGYLTRKRSLRVHAEQDLLTRYLVASGTVLAQRRNIVSIMLVVLSVAALVGGGRLFVNSSWLSDFRDDSEVRVATDVLNQRFDGSLFLNVVIEAAEKDGLKSPQVLKNIEALQQYAETLPDVGDTLSVVDYLTSMNKSLNADDEQYRVLPDNREQIAEYLYLYSVSGQPELLDEVIDFDYQWANLTVSLKTDETQRLKAVIDALQAFADEVFDRETVSINLAGSANNSYVWADLLIDSQTHAILFSKLAILVMGIVIFRSFLVGVMVVAPVALTTLLVTGAAGWLAIPLDVSTALAAGVAIGVGVDYAVHYIFRYSRQRRSGHGHDEAVQNTLRSVGRTIVFNAVVVAAGFSVLLLSQFPPHVKLGYFVFVYMLLSCVVALTILPLYLRGIRHHPT